MKKILFVLISITCTLTFSQKANVGDNVGNFVETNSCSDSARTISDVTSTGKSLLIVASGYDCSICRSEAPSIATFANENKNLIEVWGAMHNRFSANTPTCSALNSWNSSYQWSNIFMFNDVNRVAPKYWAKDYTYYTVIDTDNEIVYYGNNGTTARQRVLELSKVTSTYKKEEASNYFSFYNNTFVLNKEISAIHIFNTSGLEVLTLENPNSETEVSLNQGLYLVGLETAGNYVQSKIWVE